MAKSGCSGHAAGTTALPLKADLQAAMSASPPISSASPPGADLPGDAPVRLVLAQSRHRHTPDLVRSNPAIPSVGPAIGTAGSVGLRPADTAARSQLRVNLVGDVEPSQLLRPLRQLCFQPCICTGV